MYGHSGSEICRRSTPKWQLIHPNREIMRSCALGFVADAGQWVRDYDICEAGARGKVALEKYLPKVGDWRVTVIEFAKDNQPLTDEGILIQHQRVINKHSG